MSGNIGRVSKKTISKFRNDILRWAKQGYRDYFWRKDSVSCYKKVIAELLLQRTGSKIIAAFCPQFFKKYPSWKKLAATTQKELERTLRPIGLSKQRAPRMLGLARIIAANNGRMPNARNQIEQLPGVGQYVTNAIELLCFERPSPLLDVNMARVLERYFGPRRLADIRYDPYLQSLAKEIVDSRESARVNFAILDFAHQICTSRKPLCHECPLSVACRFARMARRAPQH
jgi:A/G-specific adenine glycosylase